jgi:hypothetical protein
LFLLFGLVALWTAGNLEVVGPLVGFKSLLSELDPVMDALEGQARVFDND